MAKPAPIGEEQLTSEAKAYFCAEVPPDPGAPRAVGRPIAVAGPLAPAVAVLVEAVIPRLISWLLSRYKVTPKEVEG